MCIQNKEDFSDAWELLERNKTVTLWCHEKDSRKKKHSAIDLSSEHDAVSNSDSELVKLPEANEGGHQVD